MKIAILGYGVEGKSVESYFGKKAEIEIFDGLTPDEIADRDFSEYDLVFRSPSIRPPENEPKNFTSITKYFFENTPTKIIGITGTKGKGTTCSIVIAILNTIFSTDSSESRHAYLVGNIGKPAIDILDKLKEDDVVVYEMSSFQLWDLEKSPHIAGVLRIEPDHLDKHGTFENYVDAKTNIARHQSEDDYCIFYQNNDDSVKIAKNSQGKKLAYPFELKDKTKQEELLNSLNLAGNHNRENAEAALLISASYFDLEIEDFIDKYFETLKTAFKNLKGLPHRLEYVGEFDGIKYYDDNFSSAFPAMDVAIATFKDDPLILIAGGKDRGLDYSAHKNRIFNQTPNLKKAILIGEIKEKLVEGIDEEKYYLANSLEEAMRVAKEIAKKEKDPVILMSPGAPSFDMFKDFKERGELFQKYAKGN